MSKKAADRSKPEVEEPASDAEREPPRQRPRTDDNDGDEEFDPETYDEKRRRELERYKEVRPKG